MNKSSIAAAVAVIVGLAAVYRAVDLEKRLESANKVNQALVRLVDEMTPCDKAVRESRMLFQKQLQLRNNSIKEVAVGHTNHEQYDRGINRDDTEHADHY